ncbi:unnamed protein product [Leptidea sinapis]|uniref:Uncharacterized protein n=1 Tax=Leptidea sinapis TaxID=189913 RepID=A0A5E4QQA4_9NEOP|nr:unnamed protein product [Leptidea sinapis]
MTRFVVLACLLLLVSVSLAEENNPNMNPSEAAKPDHNMINSTKGVEIPKILEKSDPNLKEKN